MNTVKPLLLIRFGDAHLTGGFRRKFEVLKTAHSQGVPYVILTDAASCLNASKMFPNYLKVLSDYRVFLSEEKKLSNLPLLKQLDSIRNIIHLAVVAAQVATRQNVDLIVGDETTESLIVTCVAGKLSSKPWTVVFQPFTDLLQPNRNMRPLNALNIISFVSKKASVKSKSMFKRTLKTVKLFLQLKIAQRSLMLTVSTSTKTDLSLLNPKIRFFVINPGNGVDWEEINQQHRDGFEFDALFFARLIPEKGLYDLPLIWAHVLKTVPNAKLAVAGISESPVYVNRFMSMVRDLGIERQVCFLGHLNEASLFKAIKSSKVVLQPSILDALPLVTLESLACSTPVIAYDISALKLNFGECPAVLRAPVKDYTEMANLCISILTNSSLQESLSNKAAEFASVYTWKNAVQSEKAGYIEVINQRR